MITGSNWALITGASGGIGSEIAFELARQGRNVIVHYRKRRERALEVAAACVQLGVDTRVVEANLLHGLGALEDSVRSLHGVGILVNNAGVIADSLAAAMTDTAFDEVLQVNLKAAFALTRLVLPGMIRQRAGRIVNISSVAGLHGNAGQANYAASKGALVALTKALAREVASRNITVNAVAPGLIATTMTAKLDIGSLLSRIPAGRIGTPAEVASAVGYLCSDAAAYVNGVVLNVDGGWFA